MRIYNMLLCHIPHDAQTDLQIHSFSCASDSQIQQMSPNHLTRSPQNSGQVLSLRNEAAPGICICRKRVRDPEPSTLYAIEHNRETQNIIADA